MIYKLILFTFLASGPFASAGVTETLDEAGLSFHLYVATQKYYNCTYWNTSLLQASGELAQKIVMYASKGMIYPVVPLIGPILVDSQVEEARHEVEQLARAGDLDVTHSEHYKMLVSAQNYQAGKCVGSYRYFRRSLKRYLKHHAKAALVRLKQDAADDSEDADASRTSP